MLRKAQPRGAPVRPGRSGALFYGDNLAVLREHIPAESVDLIYLDPPFNSNRSYNVLFKEANDIESEAQIRAFEDYWRWDASAETTYRALTAPDAEMRGVPPKLVVLTEALRSFLGTNDMMAYLVMMAIRLVEMHRVLKPTGSIYLHCDPTASHYLKLVMDAIFGARAFRNEVIWRYRRWPTRARQHQKMHDVLLFYSKEDDGNHVFHTLYGYEKLAESTLKTFGTKKQVADFSSGHRKPGQLDEESAGPPMSDVWDVSVIAPIGKERVGYPTQKPEALLERVILASSDEGAVVLDPFCGCGTAVVVAEKLGRRWIGIDITHLAIALVRTRLETSFPTKHDFYDVIGEPIDVESARVLAEANPYQFQWWALHLIGARPTGDAEGKTGKAGADGGIDGVIRFRDDWKADKSQRVIVSVKAGRNLVPAMVRDLRGTMEREGAPIGVLLSMYEPTAAMRTEAARAGTWRSNTFNVDQDYPRIQLITIEEAFEGRRVDFPGENRTLRSSPPAAPPPPEQQLLPGIVDARPRPIHAGLVKTRPDSGAVRRRRGA